MVLYVPGTEETDPKKQNMSLQALGAAISTNTTNIATLQANGFLRGLLAGLTLSTAGSSATFGIAAGSASDSTSVAIMNLASAYTKTTSAWALGSAAGSLDTGAIANSTWYHVYLIKRVDTGVVDVLISLSATAPTMPASYTLFRRIGSMKTNGSAQWTKFIQQGTVFYWDSPVLDASNVAITSTPANVALSIPPGVSVRPIMNVQGSNSSGIIVRIRVYSPLLGDNNSVNDNNIGSGGSGNTTSNGWGQIASEYSDTTQHIRIVETAGDANVTYYIATIGWIDDLGRYA